MLKVKRYFLDPSTPLRAFLGQENISLNRLRTKREKDFLKKKRRYFLEKETLVDQSLNTGLGRSKMQCFCSLTLFVCGCTRVSINIDVPLENHITSSSLLLPSSLGLCLYRLPFFLLLLSPNSHIFGLEASLILCLGYSETFSLFPVEMDI